jgi:hypothetical protein
MPRKLKTYQTSLGFFDLAIAAPSMKAALEAWGSHTNLFHQGFAKETNDPAIVAATVAKPGVILRRPVGSSGGFSEYAEPPKTLTSDKESSVPGSALGSHRPRKFDDETAQEAAAAYARAQKERDRERRRQEAIRESERKRREQGIANAEAALKRAQEIHDKKAAEIAAARSELDRRSEAEEVRWDKQRAELEAALVRARE